MEKINEKMYQANIDLVDKNKLLEEDKKILLKRMNKAIDYIYENAFDEERKTIIDELYIEEINDLLKILKGKYMKEVDKE